MTKRGCVGCVVVPAVIAAGVLLFVAVEPSHAQTAHNPSWLDSIFGSRVLLGVVRVAIIAGLAYVILSILALISQNRWLDELGPAKAAKRAQVEQLSEAQKSQSREMQDALATISDLERRLDASDKALTRANGDMGYLLDYVDTLERDKGLGT